MSSTAQPVLWLLSHLPSHTKAPERLHQVLWLHPGHFQGLFPEPWICMVSPLGAQQLQVLQDPQRGSVGTKWTGCNTTSPEGRHSHDPSLRYSISSSWLNSGNLAFRQEKAYSQEHSDSFSGFLFHCKDLFYFPGNTQEIKLIFHLAQGCLAYQRPRFALVLPHEKQ